MDYLVTSPLLSIALLTLIICLVITKYSQIILLTRKYFIIQKYSIGTS